MIGAGFSSGDGCTSEPLGSSSGLGLLGTPGTGSGLMFPGITGGGSRPVLEDAADRGRGPGALGPEAASGADTRRLLGHGDRPLISARGFIYSSVRSLPGRMASAARPSAMTRAEESPPPRRASTDERRTVSESCSTKPGIGPSFSCDGLPTRPRSETAIFPPAARTPPCAKTPACARIRV